LSGCSPSYDKVYFCLLRSESHPKERRFFTAVSQDALPAPEASSFPLSLLMMFGG
jgi:hypothetical protein